METITYTLSDPETSLVRYVGKTIVCCRRRLNHHINKARQKPSNHRDYWIKGLLLKGLRPILEELDRVSGNDTDLEKYWISQLKSWGFNLTNMTDGGEGLPNYKRSKETIEKTANANRGNKISIEGRKNMSEAKKGKPWSDKFRLAQKIARIGHKVTEETKAKIGKAHSLEVECYRRNGEYVGFYLSYRDCANKLGLSESKVGAVVRGDRKTHKGYIFKTKQAMVTHG